MQETDLNYCEEINEIRDFLQFWVKMVSSINTQTVMNAMLSLWVLFPDILDIHSIIFQSSKYLSLLELLFRDI